ncbi:hypothetical protein Aph02nite_39320 [Actinoplanes philippinensis]|uniref:Uncharacterized protein n=1 Tax=Actinoplanes philippinensis TaxID=35752 RepID=A0A1I2GQI8_9ACTN|nr:hypothetical protein [Actinoplanes philippinensis]GIE77982.1 hypothetical protein Aph02nite_39320 [Actinoplanes philippinensis]SFF19538.1 hypothetical protein SAMN05421541_10767 [Actinoplanes philippinensis]
MDVLFDAVDRALESARRRWPATLFVLGAVLWVSATAAVVGVALLDSNPQAGAVLAVPPAALLAIVATRGITRLRWPVWLVGVALPVVLAGLVAPQAARFDDAYAWVIPVVAFVYAQIFLGTVAAGDELFRRRVGRTGKGRDHMSAVGRRRILQVKVLVATLVVLVSSQIAVGVDGDTYAPGNQVGWSAFEYLFSCVSAPMFVAVWWRKPALAWYAVAVLPLVFALSLLPRTPEARLEAVLAQGWIVVAATWQWSRAAVKPFWRDQKPRRI